MGASSLPPASGRIQLPRLEEKKTDQQRTCQHQRVGSSRGAVLPRVTQDGQDPEGGRGRQCPRKGPSLEESRGATGWLEAGQRWLACASFISCVTLGKSLTLSGSWFSHL